MSQGLISFRCFGRTDRSELHVIEASDNHLQCSCQGTEWCSHIDATLVAGERHMVPSDDHLAADAAQALVSAFLRPPENWAASWKDDKIWRGLAPPRNDERMRIQWEGRPTVTFLGNDAAARKSDYIDHALSLGWRIVDKPTHFTTLVVSSDLGLKSKAGRSAVAQALPVITHHDWQEWCYELTNAVMDRIEELGFSPREAA